MLRIFLAGLFLVGAFLSPNADAGSEMYITRCEKVQSIKAGINEKETLAVLKGCKGEAFGDDFFIPMPCGTQVDSGFAREISGYLSKFDAILRAQTDNLGVQVHFYWRGGRQEVIFVTTTPPPKVASK